MFSFFKKKPQVTDISWLGVDMHSHLLPGIDDGSPDVAQSVALITKLNALGFNKFLCTPHIFKELYPNTCDTINPALASIEEALEKAKLNVEIGAAAEHMVDENFEIGDELMCLPNKHILIEMSYLNETPNIEKVIFDLQIKGYNVILAHPERYTFYHKDHARFHRYKDMGVLLQLNLLSVTGYYGKEVKRTADYLLEHKLYDLAGTDLHHDKHLDALTKAVESGYLHEKLGSYSFKNKKLFNS
ncbi:tyrosine-protein phosphatase [Pedobacter sp. GR22-6]|uniref:tyrosine-protein phosphatase n=1 Tax=Pedobacter sp. GR22-6 TaxID=3127957 RepID=UPI00307E3F6C